MVEDGRTGKDRDGEAACPSSLIHATDWHDYRASKRQAEKEVLMEQQHSRASGFASMDAHKQREIARKGGMAAHRKGTAHEFTRDEARNAGRKGGQQVSANRSHMTEIGRVGGRRSAERRRHKTSPGQTGAIAPGQQGREELEQPPLGVAEHEGRMESETESPMPQQPPPEGEEPGRGSGANA